MKPATKTKLKTLAADALFITLGGACFAVSVVMFSAPNRIAPGGATGLATLMQYLWGLPIGVMTLVINIPLLLAGAKRLGRSFLLHTLAGLGVSAVLTDLLDPIIPAYEGDRLLVCLFGGALCGLGLGLILSRGGTTGGSEILARLLELRFPHISIGRLLLIVDAVVIALSGVVYRQLDSVLYAVLFAFVNSLVTDRLVYGGRRGKMAMILTDRQEEITAGIMQTLERGATLLQASGGYTGKPRQMILCAIRREEAFTLRRLVFSTDPNAFFMMLSTDEVRGFGFLDPNTK